MAKQVEIKSLSITCHENFVDSNIDKVLQNACEMVSLKHDHINLVKVDIGNMPQDQVSKTIRYICEALRGQGVDNCIFVPISKYGIQDISLERIEVSHETV
jgi:hypothetical protein